MVPLWHALDCRKELKCVLDTTRHSSPPHGAVDWVLSDVGKELSRPKCVNCFNPHHPRLNTCLALLLDLSYVIFLEEVFGE